MKEETREDQRQEKKKRREKTRREKKQDKRRDKMKRERERDERKDFFSKNVPGHSHTPDELAQNVSKKNPRRTNYSSIFPSKVQNLAVFELFTGFEFDFSGRRN